MPRTTSIRLIALFTIAALPTIGWAQFVNYEMVPVGDPGNANDPATGSLYGAVNYDYQIGKYEVTIGQYTAFLNAVGRSDPYGLYNADMANFPWVNGISRAGTSGGYTYTAIGPDGIRPFGAASVGNRPISWVNWFDAARFANWLSNGCPVGPCDSTTTENGAYSLSGVVDGGAIRARNSINPNTGFAPTHYVPTENEWYKAAYFDPELNGGAGGYWRYPTRSNDAPGNRAGPALNQANYRFEDTVYSVTGGTTRSQTQNYLTDVGAFSGSPSAYGTFDQGGNVREWTTGTGIQSTSAVMRGGNWVFDENSLASSYREVIVQSPGQFYGRGFRLGSLSPAFRTISVTTGTQTQAQAGFPILPSGITVNKSGPGSLVVDAANSLTQSALVSAGTLVLANPSALTGASVSVANRGTLRVADGITTSVAGLALSGSSLVDLTTGSLRVTSGMTASQAVSELRKGRADGSWAGAAGITSSVVAAQSEAGLARAVGWRENGDGSLTFAYAAIGDGNLDGRISQTDINRIVSGGKFGQGSATNATWSQGDYNFSGGVTQADINLLVTAGLFGQGSYLPPTALALGEADPVVAVPEPGVALVGVGLAALAAVRRRGD